MCLKMSVPINHPAAPAKSTAGSRAFSSAFVARKLAQARFMDSRKTGTAERCLTSPVCTPLSLRELVLDRLVQASKVSSMTRSHDTLRVQHPRPMTVDSGLSDKPNVLVHIQASVSHSSSSIRKYPRSVKSTHVRLRVSPSTL